MEVFLQFLPFWCGFTKAKTAGSLLETLRADALGKRAERAEAHPACSKSRGRKKLRCASQGFWRCAASVLNLRVGVRT